MNNCIDFFLLLLQGKNDDVYRFLSMHLKHLVNIDAAAMMVQENKQTERASGRILQTGVIILVPVFVVIFHYFTGFLPFRCLFEKFTGYKCIGCGMQRMIMALSEGRVAEAAAYNYFIAFMLPVCIAVLVLRHWASIKGKTNMVRVGDRIFIASAIILSAAWLILRNILNI